MDSLKNGSRARRRHATALPALTSVTSGLRRVLRCRARGIVELCAGFCATRVDPPSAAAGRGERARGAAAAAVRRRKSPAATDENVPAAGLLLSLSRGQRGTLPADAARAASSGRGLARCCAQQCAPPPMPKPIPLFSATGDVV